MTISLEAADALESAIDRKIENAAPKRTRAAATVTRRDSDGTVYVRLEGAETETPVSGTAAAVKPGDVVGVTVDNGRLTIDGNYSAPATDDTAARAAQRTADSAAESAATAASAASDAVSSAAVAADAAAAAQNSLKSVVQGATTVEKAVSVMQTALEAVVDYDPQEDTVTEYFWHDANGAHVLGDESGYRNDIDSTGMSIVDVSTEDTVARFGADGAQIGVDSKLTMTQESESFEDSYGNVLFSVEADANKSTTANSTTFDTCDGIKTRFTVVGANSICEIKSVTIDNVETDNYVRYGNTVTFLTAPPNGSIVKVTYYPYTSDSHISYTLGVRDGAAGRGMLSVSEGLNCVASGKNSHAEGNKSSAQGESSHAEGKSKAHGDFSHAEGYSNASGTGSHAEGGYANNSTNPSVASGDSSHAEGMGCTAHGTCSHAEGELCQANGDHSHAQNENTRASSDNQTALGKFNIADPNDTYAVIVGNGTADNARSDALRVDWSGNVGIAGDVQDLSGNQLYADSSHTHAASDITGIAFRSGIESITPVSQGIASKSVSFDTDMPGKPVVTVTLGTAVSAQLSNWHLSVTSTSASGFTLNVYNAGTNTTARNVCWMAIYQA